MPYVGRDAASFTTVVDVTVSDDLTVTDDATIGGALSVTGDISTAAQLGVGQTTTNAAIDIAAASKGAWSTGNVYNYPTGNAYINVQGTSGEHNWIGITGAYGATAGSASLMLQSNFNNTSQDAGNYISSEAQGTADSDLTIGKLVGGGSTSTRATKTEFMRIDNNGHITKPLQPAFQAIPASDQTNFAVNAAVTVVFGTEVFDVNADFASNTFTAPVTGKYQLNVKVRLENIDSANNSYHLSLDTSNRSYGYDFDPDFGQDNAIYTMSISTLADMDAGDTAIVRIVQASGTAQTDIATESYFSGFLAC
jgi:hypothetical protein